MKKKMLIVDDMEVNRLILSTMFKENYEIVQASNGLKAIEVINEYKSELDIVLLDIIMPELDGFGVLKYMNENEYIKNVPVILITGNTSTEVKKKGYKMGVSDVIEKPFDAYIVKARVGNVVSLYEHRKNLEHLVEKQTKKIQRQAKKLERMNYRVIDTLGTVVEFRNIESGDHIRRVREFTSILAKCVAKECTEYKLNDTSVWKINYAAAMHDVGKIATPDHILLKPGRLTDEEFAIMKQHTVKGSEIIKQMDFFSDQDYKKYCYNIARSHHEKYDGRGYPDGLKGEDIPICAQIVSVADIYDALISKRVYKDAYSCAEAFNMIITGECGQINPKLIKCLQKVRSRYESLALKYS